MQQTPSIRTIVKRNGTLVSYDRERITSAIFKATTSTGSPDRVLAESLSAQVEQSLTEAYHGEMLPSVEDIQDIVEKTLIENRQIKLAHNYITYRSQRAMRRATRAISFEVTDNIPYKKIYEVLLWNMAHRCESVEALNDHIRKGSFAALVQASENRFSGEIQSATDAITARGDATRLIIVSGPSSSGKTTTTIKIWEALQAVGKKLKAINIDNYFFDLEKHPRDEFGDYDYETPQALNLELINHHLGELLAGRSIKTPFYNFKTGKSTLDAHKFRLYVETLGQLRAMDGTFMRWADNRLLRRMIRDKAHRNLQPMETLTHWHYVRRSELKYIIPFIGEVDFIVNTALPFELPLLKARLWDYLPQAMTRFQADPRRQDAFVRAKRVHDLLAPLEAHSHDALVPPTSLLREFIGGSQYRY
jgi:uridine kinase